MRYFVFAVRFLVLPRCFCFCREVFGFTVTVVSHHRSDRQPQKYVNKLFFSGQLGRGMGTMSTSSLGLFPQKTGGTLGTRLGRCTCHPYQEPIDRLLPVPFIPVSRPLMLTLPLRVCQNIGNVFLFLLLVHH